MANYKDGARLFLLPNKQKAHFVRGGSSQRVEVVKKSISRLRCENIMGIVISAIDKDTLTTMLKNDEEAALLMEQNGQIKL